MADPQPFINDMDNEIPPNILAMFAREEEVRSTLAVYAAQEAGLVDEDMPGDARDFRKPSDRATKSSAGMLYWGVRLHEANYSLYGMNGAAFPEEAFCVDINGSVKGSWFMVHRLVPLDDANVGFRAVDMRNFAGFARQHIYRPHLLDGVLPQVVVRLLDSLETFTPDQYVLIKSHPALEDCIGEAALFIELNALFEGMKETRNFDYNVCLANIQAGINNEVWVFDGVQNQFVHELLGYNSNEKDRKGAIASFLGKNLRCGLGRAGDLLTVRRNGHSHLTKDYRVVPAGHDEAVQAALAAAIIKNPALRGNYQGLAQVMTAPFTMDEAKVIAAAIDHELDIRTNSAPEALGAAIGVAEYLSNLHQLHTDPRPHLTRLTSNQYPPNHYQNCLSSYVQQEIAVRAEGATRAAAVRAQLPPHPAPLPLQSRIRFEVRDVGNMLNKMEPNLVCLLHEEMFRVGELNNISFHWEGRDLRLDP